jgi:hypothetical protein
MTDVEFLRFISCVGNHGGLAGMTTLALYAGGKKSDTINISPDTLKKILPELPGLTSLSLSGKKVSAALLTHLANKKFPTAANLTSLSLDTHYSTRPGMLSLLKSTSRLKRLTLTHQVAGNGSILTTLSSALQAARGGGVQLLTELFINGLCYSEYLPVRWSDLARLGILFPELEVCRIQEVCDDRNSGAGRPA